MIRKLKKFMYGAALLILCGTNICGEVAYAEDANQETEEITSENSESENSTSESTEMTDATEMYDEKNALVSVNLLYVDDKDNETVIKSGYGFFVGDKASEVYLITCHHTVVE